VGAAPDKLRGGPPSLPAKAAPCGRAARRPSGPRARSPARGTARTGREHDPPLCGASLPHFAGRPCRSPNMDRTLVPASAASQSPAHLRNRSPQRIIATGLACQAAVARRLGSSSASARRQGSRSSSLYWQGLPLQATSSPSGSLPALTSASTRVQCCSVRRPAIERHRESSIGRPPARGQSRVVKQHLLRLQPKALRWRDSAVL